MPNPQGSFISDAQATYLAIPPVTRLLMTATVGVTLAAGLGMVSPMSVVMIPEKVYMHFEIWRLVTCFFYAQLGFPFLMNLYFMYSNALQLETGHFARKPADFLFFITFSMACLSILGGLLERYTLMDSLLLSIIYLWSQINKTSPVTFMFGMQFQAMYLPWVLVAFDVLTGDTLPIGKLIGIVVGHLYYYLTVVYPSLNGGKVVLETPAFMRTYMPDETTNVPGARSEGAKSSWGKGSKLGSN